jgi:hypothetical protein
MKNYITIICCLILMSFKTDSVNSKANLYQGWHLTSTQFHPHLELTYVPTIKFGDSYGYWFKKDETVIVSRAVSSYQVLNRIPTQFEQVEGKWKFEQDSVISITYTSNNRTYEEQLIVTKLDSQEFVVKPSYVVKDK